MKASGSHAEVQLKPEFDYGSIPSPNGIPASKEQILKAVELMGKGQIEGLRTGIKGQYLKRFKRPKINKYGSLSKAFTEQQLNAFLHQISNPKHKLLFEYQAQLGLRIGEVVRVRIQEIDFDSRELKIHTEKVGRQIDVMLIPIPLFRGTLEFIKANSKEIEENEGYLFFREKERSNRAESFMEPNYVRRLSGNI